MLGRDNLFLIRLLFIWLFLINHINLSSQSILIEEFTNLSATDYNKTNKYIDSVATNMKIGNYHIIKYHTNYPANDTFNSPVQKSVNDRLFTLGNVVDVPTTVVDGKHLPKGINPNGNTLNLTSTFLDSILDSKNIKVNFFGMSLEFSEDFKQVVGASGVGSTSGLTSQTVTMTRALVEEVIDVNAPVGPDGIQRFTNIFRGIISRVGLVVPVNGSHHSGSVFKLPKGIVDPANLKMIVFVEDSQNRVIDCVKVSPNINNGYNLEVTNTTIKQSNYCINRVVPKISIKNICPYIITGIKINQNVENLISSKIILDTIFPGEVKIYEFDTLTLSPGRHYIDTNVEYIQDSLKTLYITKTNGEIRYLVFGDHPIPNEDFESSEDEETGNFMVRSQNDFTFVKVNASDLDHDQPLGGYGNSEHSLLIDSWNWKWDKDDAGIAHLSDNKNFAFLIHTHFGLKDVKYPTLYFDVATSYGPQSYPLEIGIATNKCGNSYQEIASFSNIELSNAPQLLNKRYIPKSNEWRTKRVSLDNYAESESLNLRFFATCHIFPSLGNSMYLDNIKIKSDTNVCIIDNINLQTQGEVNNFVRDMNHCNILKGDLCIGSCDDDSTMSSISSISGLTFIREIQGSLVIKNNRILNTLSGLDLLINIGGNVEITNNPLINSLKSINQVKSIGGTIKVINNPSLTSIEFHSNLPYLNGDFIIQNNPLVKKFLPLLQAQSIKGDLIISDFKETISTTGINKLKYVGGNVVVQNNMNAEGVSVLGTIQKIEGDFIVRNNPKILWIGQNSLNKIGGNFILEDTGSDIKFLKLDSLGGSLTLKNNIGLTSGFDFDKLSDAYFYSNRKDSFGITLDNNPKLIGCNSKLICRFVEEEPNHVFIQNNGTNCKTVDDVVLGCTPSSTSSGTNSEFTIYPNPTKNVLFLSGNVDIDFIEIFNNVGESVYKCAGTVNEINIETLPEGIYTLIYQNNVRRFTKI